MTDATRAAGRRRPAWPAAAVAFAFLIGGVLMLVESYSGAGAMQSRVAHAMGPAFFPRIVLVLLVVLALAALSEALRGLVTARPLPHAGAMFGMIAVTAAYVWLVGAAGFLLASVAFLAVCPAVLGYRRWAIAVPLAAVYAIAVWYVFQRVLQIVLPGSPWFALF